MTILTHSIPPGSAPKRTVVIGASGFVGRAVAQRLSSTGEVLSLGRAEIDLAAEGADAILASKLKSQDTCIFVAARAPCKTSAMMTENIAMAGNVCAALAAAPVEHLVYVSSDAVYADSRRPLNEQSIKAPDSLHGAMHLAREFMLRDAMKGRALAILRPTLIYGAADPHNGYGPNQYRRLAQAGRDIVLFGGGEERRDHVLIDDVAEIVARVVVHRSFGELNVASGSTHAFRAIAELIAELHGDGVGVKYIERKGPMPHNGYRAFDIASTRAAFPDLKMTSLPEGLRRVHRELAGHG